jgi:uncharacterized protein with GYD domain
MPWTITRLCIDCVTQYAVLGSYDFVNIVEDPDQ